MTTSASSSLRSNIGGDHMSHSPLRGCGSSVYSTMIDQPLESAYLICASICSSVRSGRNENCPCVSLMSCLSLRRGRRDDDVGRVGRGVVERDVLPDLERGVELRAALGGLDEDVRTLLVVVATLVAGLDDRLDGGAVGAGAGRDAHRVADRAAAELQDAVFAEVVQQLVHLAGVDAARGDRHDARQRGPVLIEVQAL